MIPSAIQAGGNIAGNVISNLFNKRNLKQQTQQAKEMADYAYDKDLQMWHMQNLYNQPKTQMQRYKEAGLNPNLMYGQGNSGNATSMPTAQQVKPGRHQTQVETPQMLAMYANFRNTQANSSYQEQKTINEGINESILNIDKQIANDFKWQNAFQDKQYTKKRNKIQAEAYQYQVRKNRLLDAQINNALLNAQIYAQTIKYNPWRFGGQMAKSVGGLVNPLARGAKGFKAAKAFKK